MDSLISIKTKKVKMIFWAACEKLLVPKLHFCFLVRIVYNTPRSFISLNISCVILLSLNATCSVSANFHVCPVLKDMSTLNIAVSVTLSPPTAFSLLL